MKKEEKKLLLQDLCGRLPYGVMVECSIECGESIDLVLSASHIDELVNNSLIVKPYLRSLSNMTEEERDDFRRVGGVMSHNLQNDTWAISAFTPEAYDWLNSYHFDYRGLIPMGLALEAPDGMYN